jgi:cardiolipin synthase
MKNVPNLISLSRLPLSLALFIAAWQDKWKLAAIFMIVALLTDAVDGMIARRFNVESKLGSDVLEPACDLVLSIAAVGALYVGDIWPLWVPIALLVITALLEVSHSTPYKKLKRHTYYIHPLFFIGVVYVAGLLIVAEAFSTWSSAVYGISWGLIAAAKKDRWMVWFRGPQVAV